MWKHTNLFQILSMSIKKEFNSIQLHCKIKSFTCKMMQIKKIQFLKFLLLSCIEQNKKFKAFGTIFLRYIKF